ncbi:hypothetical protein EDB19DRAFT_1686823 [Suillus lakei]|nr:hypothetical protein EDB19DRAFT_1686823 [Suillus lakei]
MSPSVAIPTYSFGFLLISVVFLFIILGCCFSHWRPGAHLGTSRNTTEQLDGRRGQRRKLVPPVLWDAWLSRPPTSTEEVLGAGQSEWLSIQPVCVSLTRACRSLAACQSATDMPESEVPADPSSVAWLLPFHSQSSSRFAFHLVHPFNFHLWPRQRSRPHHSSSPSEKPTEYEVGNHPEAVTIAVMICMPSSAFRCWNRRGGPSRHSAGTDDPLREYQIGVAQVSWTHGKVHT